VGSDPLNAAPSSSAPGRPREGIERARLTTRRLLGLDRSGPPPPETLAGSPLHPWTVPNAIGALRVACIAGFLLLSYAEGGPGGVSAGACILFAVAGWSDYADGMAARITGQYSRLGALLDPVIDRLLVAAGVLVCWNYELLPRWALAVLLARELLMLAVGPIWLRHGLEVRINWPGRLAVLPTMGGVFFGLCGLYELGKWMLYAGVLMAWTATALYFRSGLAQMREQRGARTDIG
jgi:cardiolipin synthase (CMP-forming)